LSTRALLVMPAFNEEAAIPDVLASLADVTSSFDILVVDDASVDKTGVVAAQHGATVMTLPFNLGVGGAVRAGFRHAWEQGYDIVVQFDADGQHPAESISALIEALDDADVVVGARFAGTGDYTVRGPRRWMMSVLAKVVSRLIRTPLTDVTSGFRANSRTAIQLFASEYPQEYLGDTVESLVIAGRAGLRICQVPVAMRERTHGEPSHSPVRAAVHLVRSCLALLFIALRQPPTPNTAEPTAGVSDG